MHESDSSSDSVTEFVEYSALFFFFGFFFLQMSIMANTVAAKKQFDTKKWWVGAHQRNTHVFYMIPSFKTHHSEITVLSGMNISTPQGVPNS